MILASSACTVLLMIAAAEPAQPVEWGRQALGRWNAYPWYDAKADDLRRLEIVPEKLPYDLSFLGVLLQVLAWGLLAAALAAGVYVLFRVWLNSRRKTRSRGGRPIAASTTIIERLPMPVDRAHGDLLGEARRLYDAQQYGRAILYLFAYELFQLDRHHVIRLARGKTNRQYLREIHWRREIGARRSLGEVLQTTMVAFEDVFFGNHTLQRARFEDCWSQVTRFEQLCAEAVA